MSMAGLHRLLLLAFLWTSALAQNTFKARIRNNCGNTLRVYINGFDNGPLLPGGDLFRNLGLATTVYTTFNGGKPDGSGTTRAVFYGEVNTHFHISKNGDVD